MLFKYALSNYWEYTAEESHLKHTNCSLHWQLKINISTKGTGTVGPKEVSVTFKAHIIQNITGLPEEVQFLCISLLILVNMW